VFPGLGLLAMAGVFLGVHWRRDSLPFAMTVVFLRRRLPDAGSVVLTLHDPYRF